jgi:hypothetical protein
LLLLLVCLGLGGRCAVGVGFRGFLVYVKLVCKLDNIVSAAFDVYSRIALITGFANLVPTV